MARNKFCNIPKYGNQYIYDIYEGTKEHPKVFLLRKNQFDACWIAIKNPNTFAWYLHLLDWPVGKDLLNGQLTYKQALLAKTPYNPYLLCVDDLGIHYEEIEESRFDGTLNEYVQYLRP